MPAVKAMNLMGFDADTFGNHMANDVLEYVRAAPGGTISPTLDGRITKLP